MTTRERAGLQCVREQNVSNEGSMLRVKQQEPVSIKGFTLFRCR